MVSVLSPPIHGALSGKAVAALTCLSAGLLAAILLVPDRLTAAAVCVLLFVSYGIVCAVNVGTAVDPRPSLYGLFQGSW